MSFNLPQLSEVMRAFGQAEAMVGRHFRLSHGDLKANRYDVRTLAHLEDHEVDKGAFAHLCKYFYQKSCEENDPGNFHFFRICLQDDRILNAIDRAKSFIKFSPLMMYIATHELVHIIRFNRGDSDFDASPETRAVEEGKVDAITRTILRPGAGSDMALVLDCFSGRYRIGDRFAVRCHP